MKLGINLTNKQNYKRERAKKYTKRKRKLKKRAKNDQPAYGPQPSLPRTTYAGAALQTNEPANDEPKHDAWTPDGSIPHDGPPTTTFRRPQNEPGEPNGRLQPKTDAPSLLSGPSPNQSEGETGGPGLRDLLRALQKEDWIYPEEDTYNLGLRFLCCFSFFILSSLLGPVLY